MPDLLLELFSEEIPARMQAKAADDLRRMVTDKLVAAITSQTYDAIVCNYANGDMVGHTGNFDAARAAIETLDTCIGRVVDAQLARG